MTSAVAVAALLLGLAPGGHRLGLIPEDLRTVPGVREVTDVPVAPGRPAADSTVHVDLTAGIPPVGNQGAQGSCVAWAFGYYQKTQFEYREHNWNVSEPQHQFSPAFLYNQINGGVDGGTGGSAAMTLMAEAGCANMVDCPYDQRDFTSWPSESAYRRAMPFRSGYPSYIWAGDTAGINRVRQHVANGYSCVLGIKVWGNFDEIHHYNNTYCSSERTGNMRGWHAVTVVGYDDTVTTSDGPGAFRMVNSWGTGWGDNGFFWMTYRAVMDEEMGGRQAEFSADRVGYEPVLVGWARINHSSRERIGLRLGVGNGQTSYWHHDFRTFRWPRAHVAFPDRLIGFDLTDGASSLRGDPTDSLYIEVIDDSLDGRMGFIEAFSAEHLEWGTRGSSDDPPVFIPDNGIYVWATLHLAQTGVEEKAEGGRMKAEPGVPTVMRASGLARFAGRVYDVHGREVTDRRETLAPGVYLLGPAKAGGWTLARKVVIQR